MLKGFIVGVSMVLFSSLAFAGNSLTLSGGWDNKVNTDYAYSVSVDTDGIDVPFGDFLDFGLELVNRPVMEDYTAWSLFANVTSDMDALKNDFPLVPYVMGGIGYTMVSDDMGTGVDYQVTVGLKYPLSDKVDFTVGKNWIWTTVDGSEDSEMWVSGLTYKF